MKFRYLSLLLIFFLCSFLVYGTDEFKNNEAITAVSRIEFPLRGMFKMNLLPAKETKASKENIYVYPSGQSCGLKLLADGVLVLSASGTADENGELLSPASEAGIKPGDYLISFNGEKIKNTSHLEKLIKENGEYPINLQIKRNNRILLKKVYPKTYDNINFALGLWVRDSTAGLGTLTYYSEDKKKFAALGHSVSDTDTGAIMTLKRGELLTAEVLSIKRGYKGIPGELVGVFEKPEISLGEITSNDEYGIYGNLSRKDAASGIEAVPVAKRNEVRTGKAEIISTIDGTTPCRYSVDIVKILKKESYDGKNMIIEVTDKKLLEKTGGIVQGMSGSPVIQNGKLVGAVTHVFVNDPTRGYGIFIENMLAEAEKIK